MRLFGRDRVAVPKRTGLLILAGVTGGLVAGLAGRLDAALPPQYEIWRQFGMVTGDPQIPRMLNSPVERIERVDGGYRVWAGNCYVPVAVLPMGRDPHVPVPVGPAMIRTEARPAQCQ